MQSNWTIEPSLAECAGTAIEYAPAVLENLRRISVDGFIAFGHGGLEIGGVLYGAREGNRPTILAFAELECEHALGPGFVLSVNDKKALERLLTPPAGLETLGWFRSHTRGGLTLDGSDRELFDRYFSQERSIGLVLKPTSWGPATAAFFVRGVAGEILPHEPCPFAIEAPKRKQEQPVESESLAAVPESVELPPPDDPTPPCEPPEPRTPITHGGLRRLKLIALVAALILFCAAPAIYFWPRPAGPLGLQAFAATPGQVRIVWNHNSSPVLNGASGSLHIRDGNTEKTIPLDRDQLHVSSIVYIQKNSRITVRMHVDPGQFGRPPADEAIEVWADTNPAPTRPGEVTAPPAPRVRPGIQERAPVFETVEVPATTRTRQPPTPGSALPVRRFDSSFPGRYEPAQREATLPTAPVARAGVNLDLTLPDILRTTVPMAAKPVAQVYAGPRSGRLIWTGDLNRRGVIEIDHGHASIGSLSGSLCAVAAAYHILPAEFTRDGLVAYTQDPAANGHREPPSQLNGWNSTQFVYAPARASELVVLERPSQLNSFGRLVLRNDVRTYHVVVIDWTAQPDSRN